MAARGQFERDSGAEVMTAPRQLERDFGGDIMIVSNRYAGCACVWEADRVQAGQRNGGPHC